MQDFFRFKNGRFLPFLSVTSFLNFRVLLILLILLIVYFVQSYRRLWQKQAFHVSRMIRRPHVPRTGTRYLCSNSLYCCRCRLQQVPQSYRTKRRVMPLESSHGHHLPARAASVRAARGHCFDPKRASTTPGCRACSASRERRVGSLVGQNQTQSGSKQHQYEELVDNS